MYDITSIAIKHARGKKNLVVRRRQQKVSNLETLLVLEYGQVIRQRGLRRLEGDRRRHHQMMFRELFFKILSTQLSFSHFCREKSSAFSHILRLKKISLLALLEWVQGCISTEEEEEGRFMAGGKHSLASLPSLPHAGLLLPNTSRSQVMMAPITVVQVFVCWLISLIFSSLSLRSLFLFPPKSKIRSIPQQQNGRTLRLLFLPVAAARSRGRRGLNWLLFLR